MSASFPLISRCNLNAGIAHEITKMLGFYLVDMNKVKDAAVGAGSRRRPERAAVWPEANREWTIIYQAVGGRSKRFRGWSGRDDSPQGLQGDPAQRPRLATGSRRI
jgi:hypothetical protein